MNSLIEIATKHKTDKVQHGYIPYYEKHFKSKRDQNLKILEIGVKRETNYPPYCKGACSLKAWKDYFQNSTIYGIDIDPKNKEYEEDRIEIFIGNQADHKFLREVVEQVGFFDIIIDDGSHVNEHIIASWTALFPYLKQGGIYVIEDLVCSYQNLDQFNVRNKSKANQDWWGMHLLPESESYNNDRNLLNDFFAKRLFNMDLGSKDRWRDLYGASAPELESLIFYQQLCFMTKAIDYKKIIA